MNCHCRDNERGEKAAERAIPIGILLIVHHHVCVGAPPAPSRKPRTASED